MSSSKSTTERATAPLASQPVHQSGIALARQRLQVARQAHGEAEQALRQCEIQVRALEQPSFGEVTRDELAARETKRRNAARAVAVAREAVAQTAQALRAADLAAGQAEARARALPALIAGVRAELRALYTPKVVAAEAALVRAHEDLQRAKTAYEEHAYRVTRLEAELRQLTGSNA